MKFIRLFLIFVSVVSPNLNRAKTETGFSYIEVSASYENKVDIRCEHVGSIVTKRDIKIYGLSSSGLQTLIKSYSTRGLKVEHSFTFDNSKTFYKSVLFEYIVDKNIYTKRVAEIRQRQNIIRDVDENFETSANCYIYTKEKNEQYISESFNFANFPKYLELDKYQRLDFSRFRFKYKPYIDRQVLSCYQISILCFDLNNYMEDLHKEEGMVYVNLNLKYDKGSDEYYLALKDNLYVDPISLRTSFVEKEGYIYTNYLYFTDNLKRVMDELDFHINLNGLGSNKINLMLRTNLLMNDSLFGNCSNSQYCIDDEVSKADFDIGKVVKYS